MRRTFQAPSDSGDSGNAPLTADRSRRDLDLPADLILALRAHRERQRVEATRSSAGWNADGLVFPSAAGTPMYARNLIRHYQELRESAGLPARPFHALRHTAATIMFARGMSEAEVQRALGHSSIAITIDTYLHWIPTTPKRLANIMDGFRTRMDIDLDR